MRITWVFALFSVFVQFQYSSFCPQVVSGVTHWVCARSRPLGARRKSKAVCGAGAQICSHLGALMDISGSQSLYLQTRAQSSDSHGGMLWLTKVKAPFCLQRRTIRVCLFLEPWVDQNVRLLPGILLHPTSCVRIFNLQFEKTTTVSLRRLRMQCMHTFNPFTVPACNISGLKSAHMHLKTVYFLVL